jgi:thiosulfate/3-mercaptopyruvate sulfurtransferase
MCKVYNLMRVLMFAVAGDFLAVPVFAAEATPLVDTAWLKIHGKDKNVVLLDIRDKIAEAGVGTKPYIEGAIVAPYAMAGWRIATNGVPGMLPPAENVAKLIGDIGMHNDDHVVIVPWGTDSTEFASATRVYWTFRYLGHDTVSILDGGWRQYEAAALPRAAQADTREPVKFSYTLNNALRATTADVQQALKDGTKLVDGRSAEHHLGKSKSPVVKALGTLPGAVNIAHSRLYSTEDALFARPETVRALSRAVGVGETEKTITFCNTGHWASIAWFALSEVEGNKNTRMYDGSMAEWTLDASRPVENKSDNGPSRN